MQITIYHQVGEVDTSFFSIDCFHISERAHAEMAIALWNNMVIIMQQWNKHSFFAALNFPLRLNSWSLLAENRCTTTSHMTAPRSTVRLR